MSGWRRHLVDTLWLGLARVLGGVGVRTGVVFGLLVAAGERHRGVADVPVLRAVFWGAIAGLAVPLLTDVNDDVILNTVPLAAATASASVALARVARRRRAAGGPVAQSGARRQAEAKES